MNLLFTPPNFSLYYILTLFPLFLFAQIKMGDNPLNINPDAIFEIESNSQGILLPRMTSAERDRSFDDDTPHGLLIFNTTLNQFEYFNAKEHLWVALQNSVLQLSLEEHLLSLSGAGGVDLSFYLDNTDQQQLSLNGSQLSLERGGEVDLSPLFENVKDEQQLQLEGNILSLERGGSVDLNELDFEDLDEQELQLSMTESATIKLEISKGNELALTASGSIRFAPLAINHLIIEGSYSPFSSESEVISNKNNNWQVEDFVFGSPQLGNDATTTDDNKRLFFDKSKAAFRVGMAQSDQWDDENIGTYSIAMGRNTIASGYHATAFGLSTHAKAWYTTTFGLGTRAESRAETVVGSYNSRYTPEGGTRDWHPNDRLFVIGNGTGDSASSRNDALIIFKNGMGLTSADWTGTGFLKLSDRRLKKNIRSLGEVKSKLMQLRPIAYHYKKGNQQRQFGFLAQEVEKIFPELVTRAPGTEDIQSIDYLGLIPLLIAVVQAQEKELNHFKKKLEKN